MNRVFTALALMLGLGILSSCERGRVFEDFNTIQAGTWEVTDTVSFETPIDPEGHIISLAVRYNDNYDFHNLYVKYLLTDTISSITEEKLVNIQLFDSKSGKPLGNGFGNTHTIYEPLPVEQPGHVISFIQYMRQRELQGVEALGFKIERREDDRVPVR